MKFLFILFSYVAIANFTNAMNRPGGSRGASGSGTKFAGGSLTPDSPTANDGDRIFIKNTNGYVSTGILIDSVFAPEKNYISVIFPNGQMLTAHLKVIRGPDFMSYEPDSECYIARRGQRPDIVATVYKPDPQSSRQFDKMSRFCFATKNKDFEYSGQFCDAYSCPDWAHLPQP